MACRTDGHTPPTVTGPRNYGFSGSPSSSAGPVALLLLLLPRADHHGTDSPITESPGPSSQSPPHGARAPDS